MKNKMSSSLISTAIYLLAIICSDLRALRAQTTSTGCCDFNTDNCGASGSNWYWSKDKPPTISIPSNPGDDFMWSVIPGQLQFVQSVGVLDSSIVSFSYFLNSQDSSLTVTFYPNPTAPAVIVGSSYYLNSNWNEAQYACAGCCGGSPTCSGTFVLAVSGIGTTFEVAIDKLDIDSQCQNRFECCFFDNGNVCDYVQDTNPWVSSESSPAPPVAVVDPGSDYIYFQPSSSALTGKLTSVSTTINSDTKFRGNLFASIGNPVNTFQVVFYNADKKLTFTLGNVYDSVGIFRDVVYDCAVANCCNGTAKCTGTVQFIVTATTADTPEMYAVDAFEVLDTCDMFPGSSYDVHGGRKRLKFY